MRLYFLICLSQQFALCSFCLYNCSMQDGRLFFAFKRAWNAKQARQGKAQKNNNKETISASSPAALSRAPCPLRACLKTRKITTVLQGSKIAPLNCTVNPYVPISTQKFSTLISIHFLEKLVERI